MRLIADRSVGVIALVSLALSSTLPAQDKDESAASGFQYPISVASTGETRYVVDLDLPGVWQIDAEGNASVLVKGAKKFRQPLNRPRCVALDKTGDLLVACTPTREIYRIGPDGGEPKPIPGGEIGIPMSIAVASESLMYVTDLESQSVFKVNQQDGKVDVLARMSARCVHLAPDGKLWVVTQEKDQLVTLDPSGEATPVVSGRPFQFPHNVVVTQEGVAYVTDGYAKAIWKVEGGKAEKWLEGEPLDNPVGLALEGESLLVADSRAKAVFKISLESKEISRLGASASSE